MNEEAKARRQRLETLVASSFHAADWIYHDVRLDVDQRAWERTSERLIEFHEQHGADSLFGICSAWSLKTYWRVVDAWRRRGAIVPPTLIPGNILEDVPNSNEKKRAYVSAQQFIAAVAADDLDMAYAIFNAAYESSLDDTSALLWCVLQLCIRLSSEAKRMNQSI